MQRLVEENLNRDEYIFILRHLFSFYSVIEKRLVQFPDLVRHVPDLQARLKVKQLTKDLTQLGVTDFVSDMDESSLEINNLSDVFGIMYVLEGSSLGSQLILRQLQKKSFFSSEVCHFFSGYETQTGVMWRNFLSYLEAAFSSGAIKQRDTVAAARKTFEALNFSLPN